VLRRTCSSRGAVVLITPMMPSRLVEALARARSRPPCCARCSYGSSSPTAGFC